MNTRFEEINIESDPALLNRYQYDIPVVTINGAAEAFRHRLTAEEFRKRLQTSQSRISSPFRKGWLTCTVSFKFNWQE